MKAPDDNVKQVLENNCDSQLFKVLHAYIAGELQHQRVLNDVRGHENETTGAQVLALLNKHFEAAVQAKGRRPTLVLDATNPAS